MAQRAGTRFRLQFRRSVERRGPFEGAQSSPASPFALKSRPGHPLAAFSARLQTHTDTAQESSALGSQSCATAFERLRARARQNRRGRAGNVAAIALGSALGSSICRSSRPFRHRRFRIHPAEAFNSRIIRIRQPNGCVDAGSQRQIFNAAELVPRQWQMADAESSLRCGQPILLQRLQAASCS